MRAETTDSRHAWPPLVAPANGLLVLSGYGLTVNVWRGHLRFEDGIGRSRRRGIVHRATGGLERLVVLGHTGCVSLEAIRWLADVGAAYEQIDEDARVLAAFGPRGANRSSLIRAQALAPETPAGLRIIHSLLRTKITRQRDVLAGAFADQTDVLTVLDAALQSLDVATTREGLRLAEAQAAASYWGIWSNVTVQYAKRDEARAPGHWRTFGARSSPLTGGPRLAVNPANALLNYLYAIVEAEAAIAARAVGLDPGLGILHADQPSRDSLADDLMEPVRPIVDRYVLELLAGRRFALTDFYETRQGVCRITSRLTRELAESAQTWRPLIGAVAEDVARMLEAPPRSDRRVPTPLSGRNRSAGRRRGGRGGAAAGRGGDARSEYKSREHGRTTVRRACTWCGGRVVGDRTTCSDECETAVREAAMPAFVEAGVTALRQLRNSGPAAVMTPEGRRRVGERASDHVAAARQWQQDHKWPTDPDYFAREIAPRLATVSVRELAAATGLSVAYCRQIKKGAVVPHPMWWEVIELHLED